MDAIEFKRSKEKVRDIEKKYGGLAVSLSYILERISPLFDYTGVKTN